MRGNDIQNVVRLFEKHGAATASKMLGISERQVYKRIANARGTMSVNAPTKQANGPDHPQRQSVSIDSGLVIVGSDFHIWPGHESTCLKAFKLLCKELKPKAVVLNGDVLDFPKISRHAPIMWEESPDPQEEIECAQDHLHQIEQASGRAIKIWTLGNHDSRFESRIADIAPQYRRVKGVHLKDHFPLWVPAWSAWVNNSVVIKHRFKSGIHAPHNNTMWAGKTMVTGHLHSQKVMPITDYNGTRYGIDTGCVADPYSKPFIGYTEDNPVNWISGFAVLKFKDGRLLLPELVKKWDENSVEFRGEIIKV